MCIYIHTHILGRVCKCLQKLKAQWFSVFFPQLALLVSVLPTTNKGPMVPFLHFPGPVFELPSFHLMILKFYWNCFLSDSQVLGRSSVDDFTYPIFPFSHLTKLNSMFQHVMAKLILPRGSTKSTQNLIPTFVFVLD